MLNRPTFSCSSSIKLNKQLCISFLRNVSKSMSSCTSTCSNVRLELIKSNFCDILGRSIPLEPRSKFLRENDTNHRSGLIRDTLQLTLGCLSIQFERLLNIIHWMPLRLVLTSDRLLAIHSYPRFRLIIFQLEIINRKNPTWLWRCYSRLTKRTF